VEENPDEVLATPRRQYEAVLRELEAQRALKARGRAAAAQTLAPLFRSA
jgi:hypothetical protein